MAGSAFVAARSSAYHNPRAFGRPSPRKTVGNAGDLNLVFWWQPITDFTVMVCHSLLFMVSILYPRAGKGWTCDLGRLNVEGSSVMTG